MQIHDKPLDLIQHAEDSKAIEFIWEHQLPVDLIEDRPAPTPREIERAVNGPRNILDTTEWGREFRHLIEFASETKTLRCNIEDLGDYIKLEDDRLIIGWLGASVYNNIHLDLQIEAERDDVVSPLRILLLSYAESIANAPDAIEYTRSRIEVAVDKKGGGIGSFHPKSHDLMYSSITHGLAKVEVICDRNNGLLLSEMEIIDGLLKPQPKRKNTKVRNAPSKRVLGDIDPAIVKEFHQISVNPTFAIFSAIEKMGIRIRPDQRAQTLQWLQDSERVSCLAHALKEWAVIPNDQLLRFLLKTPDYKDPWRIKEWKAKQMPRLMNAMKSLRTLHLDWKNNAALWLFHIENAGKDENNDALYEIGRAEWFHARRFNAKRRRPSMCISSSMFLRPPDVEDPHLFTRTILVAESRVNYTLPIAPDPARGGLNTPFYLQDRNKGEWLYMTTEDWANAMMIPVGARYGVTEPERQSTKKKLRRVISDLINDGKQSNRTIEFKESDVPGWDVKFRATPDYRRVATGQLQDVTQEWDMEKLLDYIDENGRVSKNKRK